MLGISCICIHFPDASDGSNDQVSPDLKGWDRCTQEVEKSLGASRMLAQEGWFHISAVNEMSFMDPPGNREVVPKSYNPVKTWQNCRNW